MSANGVLLLIFAIYMIAFGFVGLKTGNKKVKERKKREENCTAITTAKIVGIKEEAYLFERHEVNGKIYYIPSSHSYTGYSGYYSNTKKQLTILLELK